MAWAAAPFPPLALRELDELVSTGRILTPASDFWPYGLNDTFAFGFGTASSMDAYLDRILDIHSFAWLADHDLRALHNSTNHHRSWTSVTESKKAARTPQQHENAARNANGKPKKPKRNITVKGARR